MSDPEAIESQVDRVRRAVLDRHGLNMGDEVPHRLPSSAVEDARQLATVNAHWGIASPTPVIGSALVLVRRSMRILLRWYINPIVEQQNRFNHAAVRALFELRSENENLRAELSRRDDRSDQRLS